MALEERDGDGRKGLGLEGEEDEEGDEYRFDYSVQLFGQPTLELINNARGPPCTYRVPRTSISRDSL
ncbi:hypothetical protein LguiB_005053 [Lonicera macranthoides]